LTHFAAADAAKIIRREFQNSNWRTQKILLIPNVLIGGYKEIKLFRSQRQ